MKELQDEGKKLDNKDVKLVTGQENCSAAGHSIAYAGEGNCLDDCVRADKPRYWATPSH